MDGDVVTDERYNKGFADGFEAGRAWARTDLDERAQVMAELRRMDFKVIASQSAESREPSQRRRAHLEVV